MRRDQIRANLDLIEMEQRRQQEREDKRLAHIMYRQRALPRQLEHARARVRQLENEAARYGMTHLLNNEVQ